MLGRVAPAIAVLAVACSSADGARVPGAPDARASDASAGDVTRAADTRDDGTLDGGHDSRTADAPSDGWNHDAWPTKFDGALAINPGDCGTGQIGATFLGIPAFCQIPSANGFYQCDELANRFVRDALQHPDLDNVQIDYASSICMRAEALSAYSVWGPGYRSTLGAAPVAGDLVVLPGTPGHVAVVVGFSTPIYVTVIQENDGPSVAPFEWDPSTSFFVGAECWVHAEAAPPAELPDGGPCGCISGGDTCGLAIVDYEWWNGCHAGTPEGGFEYQSLYACDAGSFVKKADCTGLCITTDLVDASGYCGH